VSEYEFWGGDLHPLVSRFWDKNQPDNWRHGNGLTEDCVHMQRKWNDMYCTALYHWVCKKPVAPSPGCLGSL
uniref:C-type lectin domain-containing protein n=1 Tax=Balaenoptera musculus TaxID=9771 RepID=A0A8C0DH31_BALMU